MEFIENCWYRISAKALIFNEKGQILLCKESSGVWDIPGGGIDHGEDIFDGIKRELYEEMGLVVTKIELSPMYFIIAHKPESKKRPWIANICYRTEVADLNFRKSEECVDIVFVSPEDMLNMNIIENVRILAKQMLV